MFQLTFTAGGLIITSSDSSDIVRIVPDDDCDGCIVYHNGEVMGGIGNAYASD